VNCGATVRFGRVYTLVAVLTLVVFLGHAAGAGAASARWKMLAATGPTNLPPTQSEIQRVTVEEAVGGSFTLGLNEEVSSSEGSGTPVVVDGSLSFTAGSQAATIVSVEPGAEFAVGDRVTNAGTYESGTEHIVVACSPNCSSPGATITLSEPFQETAASAPVEAFTSDLVGVTGTFTVGDEVQGTIFSYFPTGTTVTAIGNGTLELSNPTGFEYISSEGQIAITDTHRVPAQQTGPIAFNAPVAEVQQQLEGLSRIGAGAVQVIEEPENGVARRLAVNFGGFEGRGRLADTDVPQMEADAGGLVGTHAAANVFTTLPGGAGTGRVVALAANIGGLPTSGPTEIHIGPLPPGIVTGGPAEATEGNWTCQGDAGETSVSCTTSDSIPSDSAAPGISVPVVVEADAEPRSSTTVTVSGGEGGQDTYSLPINVSNGRPSAGPSVFWAGTFDADGELETQAGAHGASAATYFMLNTVRSAIGRTIPVGDPKDLGVDLPPGFLGNPLVTGRCPQSQLTNQSTSGGGSPACNEQEMAVGSFAPVLGNVAGEGETTVRIYNDVPAHGYAAEFSSILASPVVSLFGSVRSSEDYGVRVQALNTPLYTKVYGAFVALHVEPSASMQRAFLTNPMDCGEEAREKPLATITGTTWQAPTLLSAPVSVTLPPVTNCAALEFTPSLNVRPTTTSGSSGTGATATLHFPQENLLEPTKLAEPPLKKAVVSLPAGVTLNASSGNGLEACSEAQMGLITTTGALPNPIRFDESAPACPDGSKLGTVKVETPLLEEEIGGTIYLAEQERNPFGSLLAIYLAIESPRFGLEVKLAGKVDLDPSTGQLTATFDYNPQLPVEELKLNFRGGGARSELATPEVCGHYSTTGSLEPWSAPESGPPAQISEPGFDVTTNCAPSADKRPFAPSFEAGTVGTQAGAYSPLVIKVGRRDGEQELKSLDFSLPKGLLAKLAGVPYCPEGAIQNAEHKSGREELASASCPAASRIGSVDTSAGVGAEPFHVSGSVYLAGPYKGAPLSSVVVTPAVAGPFDLGDVVIRAPLYVDPETAEVTAKSDPIPTILKGIPLKVRSVAIDLDRPGFSLNPTSCNVMLATAFIGSSDGATAKPTNRFQVGGCDKLGFKPHLKISLKGATKRTGLPALKAVVTYPKGGAYANIQRAQVNLPHSEFLEQNNLNKTCTKPVLLEGKCPAKSIYGKAKAWSPLLDQPLEGPVYLVGGYGYKLPALVAELNGQIRVLLKGKVDSGPNKGIRATFEMVPDAPVSRFVLEMKGGKKYGLLINSEGLCGKKQRASSIFRAQNGLVQQTKPLIANQCGKKKSSKGKNPHGKKS
jgi:hypothetical protein